MEKLQTDSVEDRAWDWFRFRTGTDDAEGFHGSFLGFYETRAAFGEHLLREMYDADRRLERLPSTLRPYVRLDAELVVADWERAGHFVVCSDDDSKQPGVFVFDAHCIGSLDRL